MRIIPSSNRKALGRILDRDEARDEQVARDAARIVTDVRRRGDTALIAWTNRLDRGHAGKAAPMRRVTKLSARDLRRGWKATPRPVREALALAVRNL